MYRKDELHEKINAVISKSSDMTDEQKIIWSEIFRNLADYQEELLDAPESGNIESDFKWNIVCGITESKKLPKGFEFVSCTDDLSEVMKNYSSGDDFSGITSNCICDSILSTGYIDVPYDEISCYCGREKKYTGVLADGITEFSYSLILQNSLLNQEKILYSLSSFYGINAPVIYSPYFRRMVYVETDCTEAKGGFDLQLEKNKLAGRLMLNFRSIWNVSVSSNPAAVKKGNSFYYTLGQNAFIIAEKKYAEKLDIEINESENKREVRVVPKDSEINPKNYMIKAEINRVDEYIASCSVGFQSENNGNYPENINHIYSKSDICRVLKGFDNVVHFLDVYTEYPENMVVCSYEEHFEYPLFLPFAMKTGRPKLYLCFENDKSGLLYDRIVYTVHQIQRLFPEYIWKGGYMK